jgi:hypothetical protein
VLPHISPSRLILSPTLRLFRMSCGSSWRASTRWGQGALVSRHGEGVHNRPSTDKAIFKRMTDADAAPFKNLQPDPWSTVRELLEAA